MIKKLVEKIALKVQEREGVMQYRLVGNTMPAVEVLFDSPGESMYTQSGGMAWMTEGIRMDTNTEGRSFKGCWSYVYLGEFNVYGNIHGN